MTSLRQGWRDSSLRQRLVAVLRPFTPRGRAPILYHIDSPGAADVHCAPIAQFQGWAVSRENRPIRLHVNVAGQRRWEAELSQHRPDVVKAFEGRLAVDPRCGFSFRVETGQYRHDGTLPVPLEFDDGRHAVRTAPYRLHPADQPVTRAQYKAVWNAHAATAETAMVSIWGSADPEQFRKAGEDTRDLLIECVGVHPEDIILEIGAGIGRVGEALAPLCKEWIGTDVSENMLAHLRRRLARFTNVRTVALTGYDLGPIPSESVDLVYCTVVFPHLDEWERYDYVREAFRVLKPGGRLQVDNFNLLTDEGWAVFETSRSYPPWDRPAHISKSSTPQELEAYLRRAGFQDIRQKEAGTWIITHGRK